MKQPPLVIPSTVDVAQAEKTVLPNGMALYTIASDDFEVLRITFVFGAGSAMQRIPFSASATVNMLAEGTSGMTSQQIAGQLDYYGSYFEVNIDRDYCYVSFAMLSKFVEQTMPIVEQIMLHPVFPEEELKTYCAKRRQWLIVDRAKIETKAREEFAKALFGAEHPYGISSHEDLYNSLTRRDLVDFYNLFYTAQNGFVVCSGRIGEGERRAIECLASKIPAGGSGGASGGNAAGMAGVGEAAAVAAVAAVAGAPPFPAPVTEHDVFVEYPGAVQSSIRIGRLLFERSHPDFVPMQVVATVLGGYFGSRLMQNLRERNGYTYGVIAAAVNLQHSGYLAIATQVGAEVTEAALGEIRAEIARLRTEPMSRDELSLVKNIMIGEMMRILDGPFGIADVTIENILCGSDNTFIDESLRTISAMTPAKVQHMAAKYLAEEDLVTVVAGEKPAKQ